MFDWSTQRPRGTPNGKELQTYNTVQDITQHLRISNSKWYEIVAEGIAPSLYIGISPRWSDKVISSWINAQSAKTKIKGNA
jgi:hypothetical protein